MKPKISVPEVNAFTQISDTKKQASAEFSEYNDRKKSPYRKWIQMNYDEQAYKADDWLVSKSPTAYRIFKFLISNMDNFNAVICSYKVIQEKFGYGQATVARAVKFLKDHQFIKVMRTGGANIYMINKSLYWNSWGSNYAYAEFDAKVIISISEQDTDTQEEIKTQIKRRQEVVQYQDFLA